jgi:hypothetical protein
LEEINRQVQEKIRHTLAYLLLKREGRKTLAYSLTSVDNEHLYIPEVLCSVHNRNLVGDSAKIAGLVL